MSRAGRIAVIAVTVAVLAAGFVLVRGAGEDRGGTASTPTTSTASSGTAPEARSPLVSIALRGGAPAGAVRTLTYRDGDTIRLRFTSDVADEVHVHGFDRSVRVPAGGSASLTLKADAEGIFEVESHATGTLVARLEVRP